MTISVTDLATHPASERYRCFENGRGMRVVGYGTTLEDAFEHAAEATFALLTDLAAVRAQRTLPVSFIEIDDTRALARWLDLLIEAARQHELVFAEFHLQRERTRWWGCATGQRRHAGLPRGMELERAVHPHAAVVRTADGWEVSCTIECGKARAPGVERRSERAAPVA